MEELDSNLFAAPEPPGESVDSVHFIILPSDVDPEGRAARLQAIAETWGNDVTRLNIAVGDKTTRLSVVVSHQEDVLYRSTVAAYDKFNSIVVPSSHIKKLHKDVYLGKLDMGPTFSQVLWAIGHVAGTDASSTWIVTVVDQTFLIVPNLFCLLQRQAPHLKKQPRQYMGLSLKTEYSGGTDFITVAAGLAFTAELGRAVADATAHPDQLVHPVELSPCRAQNDWEDINWAIPLTSCLRSVAPGPPVVHEVEHQWDLFHPFSPVRTVHARLDEWFISFFQAYHKRRPPSGVECCSPDSVSFHYMEATETRAVHKVLQNQETFKAMDAQARHVDWPTKVSGYSQLPAVGDLMWDLLLDRIVVRRVHPGTGKCS